MESEKQNREKERIKNGRQGDYTIQSDREYNGFYNGNAQTGEQKWEQSKERKRK